MRAADASRPGALAWLRLGVHGWSSLGVHGWSGLGVHGWSSLGVHGWSGLGVLGWSRRGSLGWSRLCVLGWSRLCVLGWACLGALAPVSAHAAPPWQDFPVIEWQTRTPAQLATLKGLGVTAGAVIADRDGSGAAERHAAQVLRSAGLRYYIENATTDFYAPYHRYLPGKPVNALYLDAQAAYRAQPDAAESLHRQPGLSDPAWQARIDRRLTAIVRRNKAHHPLFYSLGDETGIADLSAFWDFDTSDSSLAGLRRWLREQYGSLEALNAEWGTHYRNWDAVQPELTRAAMRRTDENFAPWSDFKAWMDEAFARAVQRGAAAVHAADRRALAGIEGVQMPGWGGYDYTRLSHAVDVMEIGDSGENLAIARSLNPALIPLRMIGSDAPRDVHAAWRSVLRGARGLIVWDEDNGLVAADASPGPRASAFSKLFEALHGPIGQALANATPLADPVAILYSPESFRVQWMLDHRAIGDAWMSRDAEVENEDGPLRRALRGYVESLASLHLQPRFIPVSDVINRRIAAHALILPHIVALPPEAVRSIEAFTRAGGVVVADTPPGAFDGHGRRRAQPPRLRFEQIEPSDTARLRLVLGLTSRIGIDADHAIEAHFYRSGGSTLLALQPRDAAPTAVSATVLLRTPASVRNVATRETLPRGNLLPLTLDPIVPTVLELRP